MTDAKEPEYEAGDVLIVPGGGMYTINGIEGGTANVVCVKQMSVPEDEIDDLGTSAAMTLDQLQGWMSSVQKNFNTTMAMSLMREAIKGKDIAEEVDGDIPDSLMELMTSQMEQSSTDESDDDSDDPEGMAFA
jgi:hypothetical protein